VFAGETLGTCGAALPGSLRRDCWTVTPGLTAWIYQEGGLIRTPYGKQFVEVPGTRTGDVRQAVVLRPSTRYSFTVKASAAAGAHNVPLTLRAAAFSGTGKQVGTYAKTFALPFLDEWTDMQLVAKELSFTTPPGTVGGWISFSAGITISYSRAVVDDARLLYY
jgi:hypothetical protein